MSGLFIEYLEKNVLSEKLILGFHPWILDHLKINSNIHPIRATGNLDGERAAKSNRAKLFNISRDKVNIVYSDNELATWLYLNSSGANFFKTSFQDYLSQKIMPVAHFGAVAEGDGNFKVTQVARPWINIRHSHIFDAGLYRSEPLSESSRGEIVSRFLRLVHPINHFLFPSNLEYKAEQNSDPRYQYVAALYMKTKLPKLFNEFIDLIKPGVYFNWNVDWEKIGRLHFKTLKMPNEKRTEEEKIAVPFAPKSVAVSREQLEELRKKIMSEESLVKKKFVLRTNLPGWRLEVENPGSEKIKELFSGASDSILVMKNNGRTNRQNGAPQFYTQIGSCYLVQSDAWQVGWNYIELTNEIL